MAGWVDAGNLTPVAHRAGHWSEPHVVVMLLDWRRLFNFSPYVGVCIGEAGVPGPAQPANASGQTDGVRARALAALRAFGLSDGRPGQGDHSLRSGASGAPEDAEPSAVQATTANQVGAVELDALAMFTDETDDEAGMPTLIDPYMSVSEDPPLPAAPCASAAAPAPCASAAAPAPYASAAAPAPYAWAVPEPRARRAVLSLLQLAAEMSATSEESAMDLVLQHRWSAFNVPIMWSIVGGQTEHSITNWLGSVLRHAGRLEINGEMLADASFGLALDGLRQSFRMMGVEGSQSFLDWLVQGGFACSGIGGHFSAEAQEYVLEHCGRLDARTQLLQSSYVVAVWHLASNNSLRLHLQQDLRHLFPGEVRSPQVHRAETRAILHNAIHQREQPQQQVSLDCQMLGPSWMMWISCKMSIAAYTP